MQTNNHTVQPFALTKRNNFGVRGGPVLPPLGKYTKSIDPPAIPYSGFKGFGADISRGRRGGTTQGPRADLVVADAAKKAADAKNSIQANRADRYFLLNSARVLLLGLGKKLGLDYPANFHRTAKCKHVRHTETVGVHLAPEFGSAFYSGLLNCGSVWACPVCTAKVQERRREEISNAIEWAYERAGYQPAMVTLTFPHYASQKLSTLLEQQKEALAFLRSGSPWKRFIKRQDYQGLIRSLELTYGDNGWHLHTHELWFVKRDPEGDENKNTVAAEMKASILEMWKSACARAGLLDLNNAAQVSAFELHAVDVKGNCSNSDYLAKMDDSRHWGIDREIAKSSTKAGKASGLHPFGLLAEYATNKDIRSGRLFLQYVISMKGKRQLFWSHGLKARVGIDEKSDEVIAEEQREDADLLGGLDADDWITVLNGNARAQVLDAAESGGWSAVQELLEKLTHAEIAKLQNLMGK